MPFKISLTIIALCLLSACDNGNPKNPNVHPNIADSSSDDSLFAKVHRADFINYAGNKTALSQLLADCSIINLDARDEPCKLSTLDFLSSEGPIPSKQQILERLIVSDPWMADNFSHLLDEMPDDMYQLFGSTTAIVIHREIRPAFFWSTTGAIYLDPAYLWLTPQQLESISHEPDYRAEFGSELAFMDLTTYSLAGKSIFSNAGDNRSQTDALYLLSALLFHELAHANDFFPAAQILNTNKSNTPAQTISLNALTSQKLLDTYPLLDETWHKLALVMFAGFVPLEELSSLSALEAASLFDVDGANANYNYFVHPDNSSDLHFEDTAMLFEEVMLKIHFDINRELIFTTPLSDEIKTFEDIRVDSFTINRYRQPQVLERAELVVNQLLPEHQHSEFFANPPAQAVQHYYPLPNEGKTRSKVQSKKVITSHYWH